MNISLLIDSNISRLWVVAKMVAQDPPQRLRECIRLDLCFATKIGRNSNLIIQKCFQICLEYNFSCGPKKARRHLQILRMRRAICKSHLYLL